MVDTKTTTLFKKKSAYKDLCFFSFKAPETIEYIEPKTPKNSKLKGQDLRPLYCWLFKTTSRAPLWRLEQQWNDSIHPLFTRKQLLTLSRFGISMGSRVCNCTSTSLRNRYPRDQERNQYLMGVLFQPRSRKRRARASIIFTVLHWTFISLSARFHMFLMETAMAEYHNQ